MCTASAVPPAEQTAKGWPSLSFQPKNNSNSNASKNSWIRKSIKYRSIPNSAKHLYTSPKNTPTCVVAEDAPAKTAEKGKATTAPAAATTNAAEEDRGRKHRLTFINSRPAFIQMPADDYKCVALQNIENRDSNPI